MITLSMNVDVELLVESKMCILHYYTNYHTDVRGYDEQRVN